tara:strand:- start:4342 stop:4743 length:402 start_codon:yes stop_codon:yes gene_type:complete
MYRINLQPVSMGRPRFSNGRVYTAKNCKTYMNEAIYIIKELGIEAIPKGLPVIVKSEFVFKRPKNQYRKADPDGQILKITKPDIDNLEKMLLDCLVYAGVIEDDNQVCITVSIKKIAAKNEDPYTKFTIYPLE